MVLSKKITCHNSFVLCGSAYFRFETACAGYAGLQMEKDVGEGKCLHSDWMLGFPRLLPVATSLLC